MFIGSMVTVIFLCVTSTTQFRVSVSHDFDRPPPDEYQSHLDTNHNHNHKRSFKALEELATYKKFAIPGVNTTFHNEEWNYLTHNTNDTGYLYYCGEDDPTDISCHNDLEDDGLADADGYGITFPEKNIFFIEASCQMGLSFHQVCSIESAAKMNPDWQVSVLFAGRLPEQCQRTANFTILRKYNNIQLFKIHVKKFAYDTPFQDFFESDSLDKSSHPVYHSSEILKYLTLYKWGGVYLNTNMIVAKSFENLPFNWIARENEDELGTAAMALSRDNIGGLISKSAVEILAKIFCVSKYCANGFGAITQALNETCQINNVSSQWKSHRCPGFRILDSKYFYPLEYLIEHLSSDKNFKLKDAHTYHIWSKSIPEESFPFYQKLAKKFCPRAYKFLASGIHGSYYVGDDEGKTRRPPVLVTESLAEPLRENVRPRKLKPAKRKKKLVKKKKIKKSKKIKNSNKKNNIKTGLLADKKFLTIGNQNQMRKKNITSATTENASNLEHMEHDMQILSDAQ